MIVSITCPNCKTFKCIQADVLMDGSVIDYPEECPECHEEVSWETLAELQALAMVELPFMLDDLHYERMKDRNL